MFNMRANSCASSGVAWRVSIVAIGLSPRTFLLVSIVSPILGEPRRTHHAAGDPSRLSCSSAPLPSPSPLLLHPHTINLPRQCHILLRHPAIVVCRQHD